MAVGEECHRGSFGNPELGKYMFEPPDLRQGQSFCPCGWPKKLGPSSGQYSGGIAAFDCRG